MIKNKKDDIQRGEIFFADLSLVKGSEQGGQRPVVIIQNNIGNSFSPTVIIVPITTQVSKNKIPTHVEIPSNIHFTGVGRDSVILTEQIRTIDKSRLQDKIGFLSIPIMETINKALIISLGLEEEL